jgi:hypothetical protein
MSADLPVLNYFLGLLALDTGFWHSWTWRTLLALLLTHAYFHSVGTQIGRISGRPREMFGHHYSYRPWVGGVICLAMFLTNAWLSVLTAMALAIVFIALSLYSANMSAFLAIAAYDGADRQDLEDLIARRFGWPPQKQELSNHR